MSSLTHDVKQFIKLLVLAAVLSIGLSVALAWTDPTQAPPAGNTQAPVNVGPSNQTKAGQLWSTSFLGSNGGGYFAGVVGIGDPTPDTGTGGPLKVDVEGNVGATKYCDQLGNNCYTTTEMGGGGTGGGVSQIIAGTGITVSPTGGTGDVTVSSTGGGGGGGVPAGLYAFALGSVKPPISASSNYSRIATLKFGRILGEGIQITANYQNTWFGKARVQSGLLQTRVYSGIGDPACDSGWQNSNWAITPSECSLSGSSRRCATVFYEGIVLTKAYPSPGTPCPPTGGNISGGENYPASKLWEDWD